MRYCFDVRFRMARPIIADEFEETFKLRHSAGLYDFIGPME